MIYVKCHICDVTRNLTPTGHIDKHVYLDSRNLTGKICDGSDQYPIPKRLVILYRDIDMSKEELIAAQSVGFFCTHSRMVLKAEDLVIGRYSVLPFYEEQHRDCLAVGARLINTYNDHRYIANLEEWYADLEAFTPKTWFRLQDIPERGPFFLKGETNSRRNLWKTHSYAETKADAIKVALRLQEDSLICTQKICIRKFEKLKCITTKPSLSGMPISEEYRFFVLNGQILSGDFYWSCHEDILAYEPDINRVPKDWLQNVISLIQVPFVVIDVGIKENGEPIVIELNDGQQSGLSKNDPVMLYSNLFKALKKDLS